MQSKILAAGMLVGVLAGCTARNETAQDAHASGVDQPTVHASRDAIAKRTARIAGAPDTGKLFAYDADEREVRSGALTYRQVELSEAHALNAISTGELEVQAPDGERVSLRFERAIEHDDGNWSWIGRPAGGAPGTEAVITFGEKAVFGTIPQPGKAPMNLTVVRGKTYLAQVDPKRITKASPDASGQDYVLANDFDAVLQNASASTSASSPRTAGARAESAVQQPLTANGATVDIVVGYSAGFASRLGGDSQALTRLANMVDTANTAYRASQVDGQVRVVHALRVDYADTTSNRSALFQLSGLNCTLTTTRGDMPDTGANCTTGTVPAALQPIVTARNRYRGDVAVLLRTFESPEQGSCGIAWMLGNGQVPITANDADRGLAVVSDSSGSEFPDEGATCREETLAHELGHVMGLQHNREVAANNNGNGVLDPQEVGRFDYAFGMSTAGTGAFFTVMGVRTTGQQRFLLFSNPGMTCGSQPCGIADVADNARAIRQTMPIIASFRTHLGRTDVNADGRSDLLWRNNAGTHLAFWQMSGGSLTGSGTFFQDGSWSALGSGDFDGDGRVEVLWSNGAQLQMWHNTGGNFEVQAVGAYPAGWSLAAIGDIDGDGRSDLFWRHDSGQFAATWLMNGNALVGAGSFAASPAWNIIGSGDFNGDNRLDLVWTNNAQIVLWQAAGAGFAGVAGPAYPAGWSLAGVGDFDGDRRSDLLWRDAGQTSAVYWTMREGTIATAVGFGVGAGWRVVSTGDYNADARSDVVWTNENAMVLWASDGVQFTGAAMPNFPTGWSAVTR